MQEEKNFIITFFDEEISIDQVVGVSFWRPVKFSLLRIKLNGTFVLHIDESGYGAYVEKIINKIAYINQRRKPLKTLEESYKNENRYTAVCSA